ncbi:glutamate receptor ionotropic, kainate 2-like [Watersipora subatra]|uniref:glutamate receptor ionotropic, kainate 2-like n=1 Tax=Watersipora subatra TaxID=2589382 RepID=UPI00355B158F
MLPDLSVLKSHRGQSLRNFSLSLWPDLLTMRQVYDDLVSKFDWLQIMIITSTNKPTGYLSVLTRVLESGNKGRRDVMVRTIKNNEEAVAAIKTYTLYKNVIVDLLADDCVSFTRAASDAGLLSGYYHYHFTTMDLCAYADAIGPEATGTVNVTAFSLIDFESESFKNLKLMWTRHSSGDDFLQIMSQTKNALIYDSVYYVSLLLNDQLGQDPSQSYPTERVSCNGAGQPQPWSHGRSLYGNLTLSPEVMVALENPPEKNVSWRRDHEVTGQIKLDPDGVRRSFTMQLLEFDTNGKVRKVGHWNNEDRLVITKKFDKFKKDVREEFKRINFTIAVKEEHPAVYIKRFTDDGKYIPEYSNERYSGFSIDLMKKIAEDLEIAAYHFVEVTKGSEMNDDGSWTGIVGGLMTREYDIGLSPITVNVERSEVIDFTLEYINLDSARLDMPLHTPLSPTPRSVEEGTKKLKKLKETMKRHLKNININSITWTILSGTTEGQDSMLVTFMILYRPG